MAAKVESALNAERLALFHELHRIDCPSALLAFQRELAIAILKAEQAIADNAPGNWSDHCHLLRCYGDTLAWGLLDFHAIRQLAKNRDNKPNLVHQRKSIDGVFEAADEYVRAGAPVVISDLTNVIRIGDLVVGDDSAAPTTVEVKSRLPTQRPWQGTAVPGVRWFVRCELLNTLLRAAGVCIVRSKRAHNRRTPGQSLKMP